MWSASDDALLAGLGEGDADAAAAFVRRFQARVFGLALTILGDRAAAEDVAQEAFARAWRHASAYDARRGSVTTWLLTITRNLAIDAGRLRRAEPMDPETIVSLQLVETSDGPAERAVHATESIRVHAALRDLPAEQRRAVVRAAYLGQTAREIATVEDIPLGTAKTRIRSGLIRLRAALAPSREEPT
jgi:RNA polymerase sigma-70 factor (ECF subfamily)